jgi:hypothetical protein
MKVNRSLVCHTISVKIVWVHKLISRVYILDWSYLVVCTRVAVTYIPLLQACLEGMCSSHSFGARSTFDSPLERVKSVRYSFWLRVWRFFRNQFHRFEYNLLLSILLCNVQWSHHYYILFFIFTCTPTSFFSNW